LLLPVKRLLLPVLAILALVASLPKLIHFGAGEAQQIEWVRLPGLAVDLDISMDGVAWMAAADGRVKRWDGNNWQDLGGNAMRIAAGPAGNTWIVSTDHQIFQRVGDQWLLMPGSATDIAVSANGRVWMIGTDRAAGGFRVYKWGDVDWVAEDKAGLRIAVGPKGNPWVINDQNEIFRFTRMVWRQAPDRATDIAIAANGVSWVVEAGTTGTVVDGPGSDGPIYAWGGKAWVGHNGRFSGIATDPRSYPWGVNAQQQIFADSRSVALTR